jgi:hypothetical protein
MKKPVCSIFILPCTLGTIWLMRRSAIPRRPSHVLLPASCHPQTNNDLTIKPSFCMHRHVISIADRHTRISTWCPPCECSKDSSVGSVAEGVRETNLLFNGNAGSQSFSSHIFMPYIPLPFQAVSLSAITDPKHTPSSRRTNPNVFHDHTKSHHRAR